MKKILTIAFFVLFASAGAFAQFSEGSITTENEVKIYPNPATEYVQVKIEELTLENPVISLRSIIGNQIRAEIISVDKGHWRVDLNDLPNGYYLIVIKDQGFNRTFKFLKN